MPTYIKEDTNYFDDFDVENAQIIKHPLVEKLKENSKNRAIKEKWLDDDVADWLDHQDQTTKQAINTMIRQLMILKES